MELLKEDIEILIEALDAWTKIDHSNAMLGSLFASMICRDKEEKKKIFDEEMKKIELKTKEKDEIAVVLKAKLFIMKSKMEQSITTDTLNEKDLSGKKRYGTVFDKDPLINLEKKNENI